jgi:hypothetical protein
MVFGLLLAWAISAGFLVLACKVVGVPQPEFPKAMGVVLVAGIVNFFINFGVGFMLGIGMGVLGGGKPDPTIQMMVGLIQIPIGLLVHAGVYSAMLDRVSFVQGIAIWFIQFLCWIGLLLLVLVPFFVLAGLAGSR